MKGKGKKRDRWSSRLRPPSGSLPAVSKKKEGEKQGIVERGMDLEGEGSGGRDSALYLRGVGVVRQTEV